MKHNQVRAVIVALVAMATGTGLFLTAAHGAMSTGGRTSQPIGHFDFCKSHQQECMQEAGEVQHELLTEDLQRKIVAINGAVNKAIKPVSDLDLFGKEEVWTYPQEAGDCEDFVLLKRRMLNQAGLSIHNLLITVVQRANGEGHAVLTVHTDAGDLVLDNLRDSVLPWRKTRYTYVKRQSRQHTGQWVEIQDEPQIAVGSLASGS